MKTSEIIKAVEAWLNQKGPHPLSFGWEAEGALERFQMNSVKRLAVAWELYQREEKYKGDFFISLRDYLLLFKTDLEINPQVMSGAELYGISQDSSNGNFFASFQLPEYVNETFAVQAFLKDYESGRTSDYLYNLYTDPLIYRLTKYTVFKSMAQKLAVYGALNTPDGYTTLVSLPTGGGKSLITQAMSYQREGLTIVIVPTVSLAIDQVRVAKKLLQVANPDDEIFSYSSGVDIGRIVNAVKNRTARMLFTSPEAIINNPMLSDAIKQANVARYLKNVIIDEAHIVVDWGTSFRVDYQCLEAWRNQLLYTNPTLRTVLLSATFERHCVDVLHRLFGEEEKWIEIRCDALRHEPRYMVIRAGSYRDKQQKLLELVRKLPHPMIIYVARPPEAESVKKYLQQNGIMNVRTFTGLTGAGQRRELIDTWVDDQYEIMVATSAFGVGVDKSDVRTVIHLYVPQNPNAYYQELGRGGRDRLPCLSVMCLDPDDPHAAFQRISKRVMTVEKIIGRWNSLYVNPKSLRMDNKIFIDTTIKPDYSMEDEFDDSPASDADVNWNVYVLLFLRRHDLIRIREVISKNTAYIFVIEILDNLLRTNDEKLYNLINQLRDEEWDYYNESFQMMKAAIIQSRKNNGDCWSEMFFETYDIVPEYCAGCPGHTNIIDHDVHVFPLKKHISVPRKELSDDQKKLFGGARNLIVITKTGKRNNVIESLTKHRMNAAINFSDEEATFLQKNTSASNVLMMDFGLMRELIKKKSYYYLSGIATIAYHGSPKEIYDQYVQVERYLLNCPDLYLIHLLESNTYFESLGKSITDLLDGPVITADQFCQNI